VPCFVSNPNCNEAHNEHLNCNGNRQVTAKEEALENTRVTNENALLPVERPLSFCDELKAAVKRHAAQRLWRWPVR